MDFIKSKRILLVDDNKDIHTSFYKILVNNRSVDTPDEDEAILFDQPLEEVNQEVSHYDIDSAYQGQDALLKVQHSLMNGAPYALAFVDIRMPPGWDGIETIKRIWEVDPLIQIVICSAYSDHSWDDITRELGYSDQLLVLKKPFEVIEIRQLALALTKKWEMVAHLHSLVKERTRELEHLATHDSLTGLPNRALLNDRMNQAIAHAKRYGFNTAIIIIDLDLFKEINDTFGHKAGDILLKIQAKKLKSLLREEDTVARLGGDEFVVILGSFLDENTINGLLNRFVDIFSNPIQLEEHEIIATASFGISIYPKDAADAETLLKNADAALYHAKKEGRNKFQFYTKEFTEHLKDRSELLFALSQAQKNNELLLHYQPLVELDSGKIFGMEALLRWNHPTLGLIPPSTFITIAEDSGLIVPIGEWVLRTACMQTKIWHQLYSSNQLKISVNLSVKQFRQKNFVEMIQRILNETQLESQSLELEITESLIMEDVHEFIGKMLELKNLGVRFAIDDFGTGYSRLSYLKQFPFDRIKIDKTFVDNIATDTSNASIVQGIIKMSKNIGIDVLAVGVENIEQVEFLRSNHGKQVQGYFFSKPLAAGDCETLLQGMQQDGK